MSLVLRRAIVACSVAVAACGGGSSGWTVATPDEPEPPAGPLAAGAVAPAPGVVAVELACVEADSCNGIDDDCDGTVDEDCGLPAGAVQIAVAWNADVDLDLDVSAPSGARPALPGARGRGACAEATPARVESAAWESLVAGSWTVAVRRADACGVADPTVTVTVTASIGGRVVGVFNRTLVADETAADLISFDVRPAAARTGS